MIEATPETYPANPREWTTDDVDRFWKANGKRRVRCSVSGRDGKFMAVIELQAYVRFSNGLEFKTHCGNLVVVDDQAAPSVSATR
jgi:hypothetical protein